MNYEYIIFAAVSFIGYYLGLNAGYKVGFIKGSNMMKESILTDMKQYPTRWKFLLDKESK